MPNAFGFDEQRSSKALISAAADHIKKHGGSMTYPRLHVERDTRTRDELSEKPLVDHFGLQIADALLAVAKINVGSKVGGLLRELDLSRADYSEIDRHGKDARIGADDIAAALHMIGARRLS